jgi:hypothetical protein
MTRSVWADQGLPPDCGPLPAASEPACDLGSGGDVGALGEAISRRLFSAGLDLDFALSLDGNGPVAGRLRHAVAELDQAVKDLRSLMFAVPGPASGAAPDRLSDDEGFPPW